MFILCTAVTLSSKGSRLLPLQDPGIQMESTQTRVQTREFKTVILSRETIVLL
nr:hypothetical protein Iba_chr05fCG9470 [Ipomoea batatas]